MGNEKIYFNFNLNLKKEKETDLKTNSFIINYFN